MWDVAVEENFSKKIEHPLNVLPTHTFHPTHTSEPVLMFDINLLNIVYFVEGIDDLRLSNTF